MRESLLLDRDRVLQYGTVEFVRALMTADADLTDAMPVAFTFDRVTFHDAAWVGASTSTSNRTTGEVTWTRVAELLIGSTVVLDKGEHVLRVRITDDPEAPLIRVGTVTVE
jgi:hypothetical protein